MPTSVHSSPFPSLNLNIEDKQHLLRTADELLDQVERKFEDFLWRENCLVDSEQWVLVKEREDVRVYNDCRPGGGTGNVKMHHLLTTGMILSTLDDAMYGELNHTTEAMRIKTEYLEDTLLDGAVLETILEPTVDDPFQSTTVRWFVKGIPLLARAVFNHADNVILESTGMRQLSNGERIGFRLMHSVAFAKTPRLPSYDRVNASICLLYREATPKTVQLFMTSYLEFDDTFMLPVFIKSTADALVSVWKITKCAQMKKLAWLVEQKATLLQLAESSRPRTMDDGCSVCGSKGRSTRKGIQSACAACSQYTCKSCRVKRELCVFSPDGQLMKHKTRFCLHCMTVANKLDAAVVARDQAFGKVERARSEHRAALTAAMGGAMGLSSGLAEPSIHLIPSADSSDNHAEWSSSASSEC